MYTKKRENFTIYVLVIFFCLINASPIHAEFGLRSTKDIRESRQALTSTKYKYLVIWDTKGGTISLSLDENPKLIYDLNNAIIHCETNKKSIDFSIKEIHKYTLDDTPKEQTAINTNQKRIGKFRQQPDILLFENFKQETPINVYNIKGILLQTYKINEDGRLLISTQNWDLGIYIINTGSATYKIIKK